MFRKLFEKLKGVRLSREQWRQVGWYAAMALLLMILGTASHAYRARQAQPKDEVVARTAISVQAPAPTPETTPKPIRWVWPLAGEVVQGYSPNVPVWSGTLGQWQTHPALDFSGIPGEAVYACRDGVVADAYSDRLWGNVIVLDHGDGWRSTYCGLNTLNLIEVGKRVAAGDIISAVGPSVPCEVDLEAHVHFELTKDREPVDFMEIMENGMGMRNEY